MINELSDDNYYFDIFKTLDGTEIKEQKYLSDTNEWRTLDSFS